MGDYRIVYEVDSRAHVITVYYVRHRREVYRGL
jgi:mRNA-degrading endonuclease RelE of RelBE toxin-antitoxin system